MTCCGTADRIIDCSVNQYPSSIWQWSRTVCADADEVAEQRVAGSSGANQSHAVTVAGNNIAGGCGCPANSIVGCTSLDGDAETGVRQCGVTCSVGTNKVACQGIADGTDTQKGDTEIAVARNDIPANRVVGYAVDGNATGVGQGGGAGSVDADVVPQHLVASCTANDDDTVGCIPRNDVAIGWCNPADNVAATAILNCHTK